jgi:formimidoylglutamate deiminase
MQIFADTARLPTGWAKDVRITVETGIIRAVQPQSAPVAGDLRVDTLLPALPNLHSHSFQRAMAGMSEYRAKDRESFWTWRELMYRFLDQLRPQDIQAIAAMTFMEMQKAGYASVGEFHYLHHGAGGRPYDDIAELSVQIIEAAAETGIGITHLPVLYTYGGVEQAPLSGGQLRFGNTLERYHRLNEACAHHLTILPSDAQLGVAAHSLRAVSPEDLGALVGDDAKTPLHIHISEQTKEVEDITSAYGSRPVEWLLNHYEVSARWCLIHATHMTVSETRALAQTGATVGLCPITEANLGDGIFNGSAFVAAGGQYGVGSDSNINISLTEELRTLEYSQRLSQRERNVMTKGAGSTGEALYLSAAKGGARALGRACGAIAVGQLADLVAIDRNDPALFALSDEQLLDGLVFAAKDQVVSDLWSAGRHMVREGHHINGPQITARYRQCVHDLKDRLR